MMLRIRTQLVKKKTSVWLLLPEETRSCLHCEKQGGCASMQLVQVFRCRQHFLKIPKPSHFDIAEGEWVWLCVSREQLNRSAILLYGLPLSALVLGSMLGAYFGNVYAVFFGILGLFLAYGFQVIFNHKLPNFQLQPITYDPENLLNEKNICQAENFLK